MSIQELTTREVQDRLKDAQFRLMLSTGDIRKEIKAEIVEAAEELLRRYRLEDFFIKGEEEAANA